MRGSTGELGRQRQRCPRSDSVGSNVTLPPGLCASRIQDCSFGFGDYVLDVLITGLQELKR